MAPFPKPSTHCSRRDPARSTHGFLPRLARCLLLRPRMHYATVVVHLPRPRMHPSPRHANHSLLCPRDRHRIGFGGVQR
ncbi:Fcf2 pre-rRNA processing protein [Zea mays]|uniref:Fcf2 pre-rRNA processing protein n=1 Tax=Zea mays TaxID=4577 RepID=A0A1D6KBU4_MAIZE|nr:Fcf2 pre-rRNA processing protein [Zea mays]ONM00776.1 Fcf2 pre-rRNA processing protein [Zea mays]